MNVASCGSARWHLEAVPLLDESQDRAALRGLVGEAREQRRLGGLALADAEPG